MAFADLSGDVVYQVRLKGQREQITNGSPVVMLGGPFFVGM